MKAVTTNAVRHIGVAFADQCCAVDARLVRGGNLAVATRTHIGHLCPSGHDFRVMRIVAIGAHGRVVVTRIQRLLMDAVHGLRGLFVVASFAGVLGGFVERELQFAKSAFGIFGMRIIFYIHVTVGAG